MQLEPHCSEPDSEEIVSGLRLVILNSEEIRKLALATCLRRLNTGILAVVPRRRSLVQVFLVVCVVYTFIVFVFGSSAQLLPAQHVRPASATPNQTASMDADNAMHMSMQMSFEASTAVTLWFKEWHTHTLGAYLLSCGGLIVLCLLHEILHAYRNSFHEQYVSPGEAQYDRLQAPVEPEMGDSSNNR